MSLAGKFLDFISEMKIVEMSNERKDIIRTIEGQSEPLIDHLIKLSIFSTETGVKDWFDEISECLKKMFKKSDNYKRGASVDPKEVFNIVYNKPLITTSNDIARNPYVLRIAYILDKTDIPSLLRNHINKRGIRALVKEKDKVSTEKYIDVLNKAIRRALHSIIFDYLYGDTDNDYLNEIISKLREETKSLRR